MRKWACILAFCYRPFQINVRIRIRWLSGVRFILNFTETCTENFEFVVLSSYSVRNLFLHRHLGNLLHAFHSESKENYTTNKIHGESLQQRKYLFVLDIGNAQESLLFCLTCKYRYIFFSCYEFKAY